MPATLNGQPLTQDQWDSLMKQGSSAASAGFLEYNPADPARPNIVPKTKTEMAAQIATLPLYLYGGPEAEEGASLGTRALYHALRAGVTGAENVGSSLIQGAARKLSGEPSGLSLSGLGESFAAGAAGQPLLEGAGALLNRATGAPKAASAAEEAFTNRKKLLDETATEAAQQRSDIFQADAAKRAKIQQSATTRGAREQADIIQQDAAKRAQLTQQGATDRQSAAGQLIAEIRAAKSLRSTLGGTAPSVEPSIINRATRDAQNTLWHTINSIHQGINAGYKELFAPYVKNETNAETLSTPLIDLRTQLQAQGRDAQLGTQSRKLLNDAIELGSPDPLLAHFSQEELSKMSPKEREGLRGYFAKAQAPETTPEGGPSRYLGGNAPKTNQKAPPGPTVDQVLTLQSRAQQILRSPTANASDKAVASQVTRAGQASLDELGDKSFLTTAEKQRHENLKGQTRSFYTDFGDLMKTGRTKTPEELGTKLFKQPSHVVDRVLTQLTPSERHNIERAFADYVIPPGGSVHDAIPKLIDADQSGILQKLYSGRYGRLQDWLSTAAAQQRIETMMKDPAVQAEANEALKQAVATPEGRAFMDQMAKLQPGAKSAAELAKLPPVQDTLRESNRILQEKTQDKLGQLPSPQDKTIASVLKLARETGASLENMPTPRAAAVASLKPGSAGHNFMLRWFGMYGPIELAVGGFGVWKGNPLMAGAAFATFMGTQGFRAAMRSEAFRERYYDAITNPNVKQAVKSLARLGMGAALQELQDDKQGQ